MTLADGTVKVWLVWLAVVFAVEGLVYQVGVILGWISPTALGTISPPDAGWGVYTNYGLFGPEFAYQWAALQLIFVAIILALAIPAAYWAFLWHRKSSETHDSAGVTG